MDPDKKFNDYRGSFDSDPGIQAKSGFNSENQISQAEFGSYRDT